MLELDELLDLCDQAELRSKTPWDSYPSSDDLRRCLDEAERLAGFAPTVVEEAAALFFALSFNCGLLGDAASQLPGRAFYQQAGVNGMYLTRPEFKRLRDMQDEIADQELTWEQVRDWFEAHLKSR
ncbi:hypothetical protein [Sorangium sp. So ce513]|jgi:hypothetical protein|uniref:hypothetical protein n=1 Tax=Sorangium sp. So ce513 TaxID=3133315 RepID=UPI003F64025F